MDVGDVVDIRTDQGWELVCAIGLTPGWILASTASPGARCFVRSEAHVWKTGEGVVIVAGPRKVIAIVADVRVANELYLYQKEVDFELAITQMNRESYRIPTLVGAGVR